MPTVESTSKPERTRPRWPAIGLAIIAVWTLAVLFWASRPITDHVPIGTVKDGKVTLNNPETSFAVTCPAPWSSSLAAPPTPPTIVDTTEGPQQPKRAACTVPHHQAQLLLVFDLIVGAVAIGGLTWAWRRQSAPDESLAANP
jgi:hypothetical protein